MEAPEKSTVADPGTRPEILCGRTFRVPTPIGTVFVTLNETISGSPCEVFLNLGKSGSDAAADAEAIGRLCTLLLRLPSTVPEVKRIEAIVRHLKGIGGSRNGIPGLPVTKSIADAVAFALTAYLNSRR